MRNVKLSHQSQYFSPSLCWRWGWNGHTDSPVDCVSVKNKKTTTTMHLLSPIKTIAVEYYTASSIINTFYNLSVLSLFLVDSQQRNCTWLFPTSQRLWDGYLSHLSSNIALAPNLVHNWCSYFLSSLFIF